MPIHGLASQSHIGQGAVGSQAPSHLVEQVAQFRRAFPFRVLVAGGPDTRVAGLDAWAATAGKFLTSLGDLPSLGALIRGSIQGYYVTRILICVGGGKRTLDFLLIGWAGISAPVSAVLFVGGSIKTLASPVHLKQLVHRFLRDP